MPRAKSSIVKRKRHKRVLEMAKGYRGSRGNLYRVANETVLRALAFAYRDRRRRKRDFRRLWILRISAASRAQGLKYSEFIDGLQKRHISLNRKVLSQIAVFDPDAFEALTSLVLQKESDDGR
ncbi:50S ribosomal protein L20 [bacterium]|nr:50S ribosomal protein L20 [bacterium]